MRTSKLRRRDYHRRGRPDGHPSGYKFNPPLPPLAVQSFRWAQCEVPSIPASLFYEEEDGSVIYAGAPTSLRSGMTLELPVAKERRVASDSLRGLMLPESQAVATRDSHAVNRASALLVRPDQAWDYTLVKLRD